MLDHGQDCSGGCGLSFVRTQQIAHGSTLARLASDASARIAMPRRLARHQLRERLDGLRHHTQLHLYHLSLRRAQATNLLHLQIERSPSAADNPVDSKIIGPQIAAVRLQALDCAMQAAKAAQIQRLWSKMALITPHLILRVAPGRRQREEGMGNVSEIRKRLVLAEKGDGTTLARSYRGSRKNEGPGETDNDRLFRRQLIEDNCGQTRPVRGSKVLPANGCDSE